jgi:ABC-type nitrate/sulfonate/bicarbonate transport system substrate-binding protein
MFMRQPFLTLELCFCALLSFFAVAQTVSAAPLEVRTAIPSFNIQYLPAMIAEEKGFFKQENLDSKLILSID